jgi:hypothetical protein
MAPPGWTLENPFLGKRKNRNAAKPVRCCLLENKMTEFPPLGLNKYFSSPARKQYYPQQYAMCMLLAKAAIVASFFLGK